MKRTWKIYLSIIGTAIVCGGGTGVIIKRFFSTPDRDYSGFDPNKFKVEGNKAISKVENFASKEQAFNSLNEEDIVNYALESYRRCDNCYSFSTGLASTIVSQTIRSCQIKNGDTYFEESVSKSSMVGVANRVFQQGKNGDMEIYSVNSASDVFIDNPVCNYNPNPSETTRENYAETYGRTLDEMFIYLIHEDTVLPTSSKRKLDDNSGYEVVLDLNPDIASYLYQFQMKNISGLDKMPVFRYIKLTYRLDNNLKLYSCHVDEAYEAVMVVTASIVNRIDYSYFPDTYYKIPELSEVFDYDQKGAF